MPPLKEDGGRIRAAKHRGTSGFSLVEVVLAIGIVGFGLVTTMGLLPVGLNTFHQAIDTSVHAQIVQQVVNDVQQTDFDTLVNSGTLVSRYFDDQGNEKKSTQPYIYQVRVTATATTNLPAGSASSNLATVTIDIANNPGHLSNPFSSTSPAPYKTYTTFMARNR